MLGNELRLIAPGDFHEPREMVQVQGRRRSDRQADAVQRQPVVGADRLEPAVGRPAGAHVVFGMDLEEGELRARLEDRIEVLRLEADAGALDSHIHGEGSPVPLDAPSSRPGGAVLHGRRDETRPRR